MPTAFRQAARRTSAIGSTGLLAAQLQGLLASVLQVLAVLLALAGLLGHELAGALSLRGVLQRSLQLLAAALPLALVLFLFVPRLPPLWTTELGPARGAVSGLSPDLDPLGIAELVLLDGSAARVLLPEGQPYRQMPIGGFWCMSSSTAAAGSIGILPSLG